MNYAQHLDLSFEIVVRDDAGEAGNDKFASPFGPAPAGQGADALRAV
jgi:hypothetical protein